MTGHLLLVDDEPGLREAVQAYLEDSGFTVDVASNAKAGWDLLQQRIPDLVISDIMMPEVDGYQFLGPTAGRSSIYALAHRIFNRPRHDQRSD